MAEHKTSPDYYADLIDDYGLLTVLYLKEHFEKQENYKACEEISRAIASFEIQMATILPSTSAELIAEYNLTHNIRRCKMYATLLIEKMK